MKQSLLWLALALSLLFNAFFAVGYVRARTQVALAASPEGVSRLVGNELELDDAQRKVFAQLKASIREEVAVYDDGLALARQELLEELDREQPRIDRLEAVVARQAELHRQRRLAASHRFGEFVSVLEPRQREMLSHRMRHGPPGRRGGPRPDLRRFDANGDGVIDDDERRAARAAMEEHRREREQRRAARIRQFDADGDGQLGPEEQQAFRAWMLEQRDGRRRGPGWRRGPAERP